MINFILYIFNNFLIITITYFNLNHTFKHTSNLNIPSYSTQFKLYTCFLKFLRNFDKLEHILSCLIIKYLPKRTFLSKQSSNLLNIKSSIFSSVTNSPLHTLISFHFCNTPYTFKFILFTKMHIYTTILFSLSQPTLSSLHLDFLYISILNVCKNTQYQIKVIIYKTCNKSYYTPL